MTRLRMALANGSLAGCPNVGGLWALGLQYFLGLKDLGHELMWLELLPSTGDPSIDRARVDTFFTRMTGYDLADSCAVLLCDKEEFKPALEECRLFGKTEREIREFCSSADVMWNFACSFRQPLLSLSPFRVLIDGDPGPLQISALQLDLDIADHDVFFTVGGNVGKDNCQVPTLGLEWRHFLPVMFLPMWEFQSRPPPEAPFTSVTQWNWGEIEHEDRVLSLSKREAYLRILDLPARVGRRFELATFIHPDDDTGDRDLLLKHEWLLTEAFEELDSPEAYRAYMIRSRAEVCCAKPIYRDLRTGWVSDRSASYLALGRPVVAEDTGFTQLLPTGKGLLPFHDADEAAAGVRKIDENYDEHSKTARALVEEFMDSRVVLRQMTEQ